MSALFDMGLVIAELKAIANLVRGPAFVAKDIKIASDSLRRVGESLLDRANELALFMRNTPDQRIAKRAEHGAALVAAKAERDSSDSLDDREHAETLWDVPASQATILGRQAKERSAASALPIVVMAANLRWAQP